MRNLLIALGLGVLVVATLFVPGLLKFGESLVPGLLVAGIAYAMLARRVFRQVEAIFMDASKSLQTMPPRFDQAINNMQKAYALAGYQFGVRSQIDTQIGVIYFLQQEFNKALPYLKRSLMFGHWMGGAMLGVIYYKKKDHAEMRKTFDVVTRRAKKQGLVWCLYGYLLDQIGDKDAAMRVLSDGVKKASDDARVQEALLALQNGKKIKMKAYKEQWYQFHLERPPVEQQQMPFGGGRISKAARRGRW